MRGVGYNGLSLLENAILKRAGIMKNRYLFALKNYRAALIAAFFFGCITPGSKALIKSLPPQSMAGIMYFFAGVGLLAVLLARNSLSSSLARVKKADLKWFGLATLFGGILGPAFLVYGLAHISSSTASLLLNFEAVSTSLLAWFIFREHFEKRIVYGMVLIVLGCLILSLNSAVASGADTLLGFVLICLACLSWGIDNNVTKNISHLDPVLIASFKGLIAGGSNLVFGYIIGERISPSLEIFGAGFLGFFGIGISLVAFIVSLSLIGTARTGAVFSTAPFMGLAISIVLLGEPLTVPILAALMLMAWGVWFHLSEDHGHEHVHDELSHTHGHVHDEHHAHSHEGLRVGTEPHVHPHYHTRLVHKHPHFPDIHHQHEH
jgi:drug/metabolite transporter (DMT)-like permease